MGIIHLEDLWNDTSGHDKVYHICIEQNIDGYTIKTAYGRRGKTLRRDIKNTSLSWVDANDLFTEIVNEKLRKGYHSAPSISGDVWPKDAKDTTKKEENKKTIPEWIINPFPQKTNTIKMSDSDSFMESSYWGLQPVIKGQRLILQIDSYNNYPVNVLDESLVVFPCTGNIVKQMENISSFAATYNHNKKIVIDSVYDGNILYFINILQYDNDLRFTTKCNERYALLGGKFGLINTYAENIKVIPFLLDLNKSTAKLEAGIFKHLCSPYMSGRPQEGGSWLKFEK